MAEIARPSARPARALVATPITLPISAADEAPTCAMMAFSSASSSSSDKACRQICLNHGNLGKLVLPGKLRTVLFAIYAGTLTALLGHLDEDFS